MLVRLGFSIAVHIEPDIFLIDDSLAVGDEEFQRKCIHKITELREKGKTVIIVSHDLDSLSRVCQRGILIKGGKVLKDDSMPKVIAHYVEAVGDENAITSIDKERLSVIFNSGRIILLWDGKPLTKSFGGYISLQVLDTWLLSWKARWQVVEKSAHYFSVEGKWEKYDLKTNIQVHLHSERRFSWRSRVQVGAHMDARKMIMGLMLENVYDYYYDDDTLKKADTFSFSSKRWRDIYRTDEENAALILKTDINLPAVVIAFKKSSDGGFQLIQKTDSVLDAIAAQTHIILSQSAQENNGQTSSVHCEADIELADAESVEQIIINERVRNKAEHKLLRLAVRGKNLHIFFNGLRLTYGKG